MACRCGRRVSAGDPLGIPRVDYGLVRVFVYVVVTDSGFAPNPFFGFCTLATCKPRVRRSAAAGDWIVGVGSAQRRWEGKLVYVMRVDETLCFDEYWRDPRFALKRPDLGGDAERHCGDNIYHRDRATGCWVQAPGCHSHSDGTPHCGHIERDTSPPRVLIAREFAYFGADAVEIPLRFRPWRGVDYFTRIRGHRCNLPEDLRDRFAGWLARLAAEAGGMAGAPADCVGGPPGSGCGVPACG